MGHGQLVVVGADAVSQEWIHLDVADVNLTLVIIDKVDLHFVVHRLCFVNFYDLFLLEQSARILWRAIVYAIYILFLAPLAELEAFRVLLYLF